MSAPISNVRPLEDIVSDDLDLPSKLPGNVNYQGLRHKPSRRK